VNSLPPSPTGLAAAREGVAALRAYAWLVVALVVVGLVLGFALAPTETTGAYRAWVTPQSLTGNHAVTELGVSTPEGPQAGDFMDDSTIIPLEQVTGYSHQELLEKLEISQPPNGSPQPPVELIANDGGEAASKKLLLAWLNEVHTARARHVQRVLERGQEGLEEELEEATGPDQVAVHEELVNLLARLRALRPSIGVDYSVYRVPAPYEAEATSKTKSIGIGGVAGLIVGVGLILLIALVDGRIRSREGLEAAFGVELLADLRSGATPTLAHAGARLRSLGGGTAPSPIVVIACGDADPGAATSQLQSTLGDGVEIETLAGGEADRLEQFAGAQAHLIVARPGGTKRREVAGLRQELAGVGSGPTGLLIV
jgi:hypothetical protein